MNIKTSTTFTKKILEACGTDNSSVIYTQILGEIPLIDLVPGRSVEAIKAFTGKKGTTPDFKEFSQKRNEYIREMANLNIKEKISSNNTHASLSALSSIYLGTFFSPSQVFLPFSSLSVGQFDFWDTIDYLKLKEEIEDKNFHLDFSEKLNNSKIWKVKFSKEDFPHSVRERVMQEKLLNRLLLPEAVIKAMIIRMGELASPQLNYETLDLILRKFMRELDVNKYIRIDREILFLRKLEEEIKKLIVSSL